MRIIFDGRKLGDTGIGRYSAQLLQALLERFDDLEVVLLLQDSRHSRERGNPQQTQRPPVHTGDLLLHPRVIPVQVSAKVFSVAEQLMFKQLDRRYLPALIHVPHFNIPLFVDTPVISTIHDVIPLDFPQELPGPLARFYYRHMNRLALSRSAAVIVPSQTTYTKVTTHFGPQAVPMHVILEAPAADFVQDERQVPWAKLQQAHGLRQPYLLVVGLHKPHKQVALAIQLLKQLREHHGQSDLQLVLVGPSDPRYTPTLKKLGADAGLASVIHCISEIPADFLQPLFMHAAALVFPSALEGFGLPILEAMACGTPVLGFAQDSNREVGGTAMLLAPAYDVRALARLAISVLDDTQKRSVVVAKGLAQASRFTWAQAAHATRDVYDAVQMQR